MKLIKKQYIRFLFTLICIFLVNDKIDAATVCRYDINDDNLPYTTLTVGYSEHGEDAVNPYRKDENGEYTAEYVVWYQFDNGPQHALKKENMNSTNSQLWNLDTKQISYRNYINGNDWISRRCNITKVDILYNSSMTIFGFSLSATENQKQFDNLLNVTTAEIQQAEIESGTGFIDNLDKKYVNCAGIELPYGVPYFIHKIIDLIKIVTPIILIILGMLDFGKAVVANDEKNMKEASSKFIRRALAAVIIFFVVAIVQFVFNQVVSDNKGAMGCINCFINDDCNPYEK